MVDSILDSWPYLCVLIIFILLSLIESGTHDLSSRQAIRFICITIFVFFFGLRGYIGWDVHSYYPMYTNSPVLSGLSFGDLLGMDAREPGFRIYMSLLKTIWNNYHFYILISTCINAIVLNYFFKRYSFNYALCFVIFMAMMDSYEVDLQRNVKSLMLFFLSVRYIEERSFWPYLFLNLIGMMFHLTSILFIPLYFFLYRPIRFKLVVFLFIVLQVFYFLQIEYLKPLLLQIGAVMDNSVGNLLMVYSTSGQFSWSKGISIGHLERTLTFLMILIYYRRLLSLKRDNVIFINAFILYACIQVFFVELNTLCNRLALLFVFSYLVIWPELFRCFRLRLNKLVVLSFIFIYSFFKVADYRSGIFFKYDNILFGADSFETRHTIFYQNAAQLMEDQTR